jgi:hypothetical protein
MKRLLIAGAAALIGVGSAFAASAPARPKAPAAADTAPADLTVLPPVPHDYKPRRTPWGDPDLRGMWPLDLTAGVPLQRPVAQGDRVWLNDEEWVQRQKQVEQGRSAAEREEKAGKLGMGHWVEMMGAGRRTSLLVDPRNGRLPELTAEGKRVQSQARTSWVRNQTYDWVTDFDVWDRCITRGFPASMMPFPYNNGLQILQSPGYVVVNLEMIHDARIIPLDGRGALPASMTNWMGVSRGHWEGNTLVIETSNIHPGEFAFHVSTRGAPPDDTIQISGQAHVTERITPTGPNSMVYEMVLTDPTMFTAPMTVRADWTRNEKYRFFEYACHEGDVQIRNYVHSSRAQRAKDAEKAAAAPTPAAAAAPASAAGS